MTQIKIDLPKDAWKAVVFGVGLLWLVYTIATISYMAGRSDCQGQWNFPVWAFWLPWSIICIWTAIFMLSLRGWAKSSIALWLATASLWGVFWLGTIG
jgi:hypothetical protein